MTQTRPDMTMTLAEALDNFVTAALSARESLQSAAAAARRARQAPGGPYAEGQLKLATAHLASTRIELATAQDLLAIAEEVSP
jgi:hypothetical protein